MLPAFAVAAACLLPRNGLAASDNAAADPKASQPTDTRAIGACIAATQQPNLLDLDISEFAARLQKPNNRIEGQDWSGQDLSGKSFSGKVLIDVKLKGAILRGADLSDAIICGGDLTRADLTGAHLERALVGGGTELTGANFSNAVAQGANIADASGSIRIDGADFRNASTLCDELPYCLAGGVEFSSVTGADLRGASIGSLCCSLPGLSAARLDGVATHLGVSLGGPADMDLAQLAEGAGDAGKITFMPAYGYSGTQTDFTGSELRAVATLLTQTQAASAHPSFDCGRAGTEVEKAVCADPQLAALDAALDWLWKRVPHTPQETETQKKWAGTRANCPPEDYAMSPDAISFASTVDPKGCIGIAYAERIKALAPKSSSAAVDSGRYTTDPPLELPQGSSAALARKFIVARGYRADEIDIEHWGKGRGKISGEGLWANGHECGFEASEAQTQPAGSKVRINDNPKAPDERNSVSFVITPQVVIRAGGAKQFQCGARGGWSDIYFRQPKDLIAGASPPADTRAH